MNNREMDGRKLVVLVTVCLLVGYVYMLSSLFGGIIALTTVCSLVGYSYLLYRVFGRR